MKLLEKKDHRSIGGPVRAFSFLIAVFIILCLTSSLHAASVTEGAQRFTLSNGFTVILKRDTAAPVAAIQIWVKTGSANETEEEAGITHLIEHMIFKGTPTRKTGEIARSIEASGGNINAYTSFDRTVYHVEIPSARFNTGLEVLLDAVQHSLFDPGELEREKEVVLEEYRRSLDIPQRELSRAMMALCYKKHPYRRSIIGYEKTIRSFDRRAILKYMDKWYTPSNMVLVAVGDFNIDKALKLVKELVKEFPKRTGARPSRPPEPPQISLRKMVIKARVQQVYLDMLWHIPSITHTDMYALDILETVLGHGRSSRLYQGLKMDANLVYQVGAGAYALMDPGLFSVDATLSPEKLDPALEAIAREISSLMSRPLSETEMERAKTISEADFVFDMEDMAGQAGTLAFFQVMTGDMYNADHYLANLKKVTAQEVLRVARLYLRPDNLSLGIMAPEGAEISLDKEEIAALFKQPPGPVKPDGPAPGKEGSGARMLRLSNGMRLIIRENHRIPEVSIVGAFLGGTRLERDGEWGISDFTAQMLTRGTTERTARDIASTIDSWAGSLNGFSGRNSIGVTARFLSRDLYAGLELLADLVLNPAFPPLEMEKVREDILAGIRAKKDRPTSELFDLFYKTLYPHHPYGHPRTGTEETIRAITRADLEKWYRTFIAIPSNFVLTVVGDVKKDQLVPYIKTLFRPFSPSDRQLPQIPPEPPIQRPREAHLTRPGAQTHLVIGYLGPGLRDRNNAPMALIDTALSGQGGRLFTRLRDKQSLAYAITAFRRPGLETGAFGAYLACDPDKLAVARKGIFSELDRVRDKGLTEKELAEAKTYLVGNLRIGLQTNASQTMQMALDELYGLGYDDLGRHIRKINAVTRKDILRAARQVIRPEGYVLVTVGPGD